MKNRKTIIVGFILVACMIVGVGYALVTDTLDIGGTASVSVDQAEKAFNQDITFEGVVIGGTAYKNANLSPNPESLLYTAHITAEDPDKASFTVTGLEGENDQCTIVFRVQNTGDLDADLKMSSCTNSNPDYFDVEYYIVGTPDTPIVSVPGASGFGDVFYELKKATGGNPTTVDIKVVVTLKATPTTHQAMTTTFEFSATSDDTIVTP